MAMFNMKFRSSDGKTQSKGLSSVLWLPYAFIISGALNVGLISTFVYWSAKEPVHNEQLYDYKNVADNKQQQVEVDYHSNDEAFGLFYIMTFDQLIAQLSNDQMIEDGYAYRDLALAYLVAYHDFNLDKALSGFPVQKRHVIIGSSAEGESHSADVTVFPGLYPEQFQAIAHYAKTERWPLTSKGLFLKLKEHSIQEDPTLSATFYLTPEFLAVEALFNRAPIKVERSVLLDVVCDGDWQMLADFLQEQRLSLDLSHGRRRGFLLDYIVRESSSAARMMLNTDGEYVVRKLDDTQSLSVMRLLGDKDETSEQFVVDLLTSPRSDAVWDEAARKLYSWDGEAPPDKGLHMKALEKFVPQDMINEKVAGLPSQSQPKCDDKNYVVQSGDNLWKIARNFGVSIGDIKNASNLEVDVIHPGMKLKIPVSGL